MKTLGTEDRLQRQSVIDNERRLGVLADTAFGPPAVFEGDWHGLDFSRGDWARAIFRGADLREADFSGASLRDADLTDARFWNAALVDADLTGARGLIPGHLAGADLAFARLPADFAGFAALDYVKSISENAAKVFLTILALTAFVLLTIVSSPDSQLLLNTGGTKLPLIDIEVPILNFLVVAPLLLLGFYLYFNLYLQRLWDALAALPAVLPDGRRLDEATYPWLINDLCRDQHLRLRANRRDPNRRRVLAAHAESWISLFLIYWLVPLLLWGVWAKGLLAKVAELTGLHVVLFTVGVALAIWFRRLMKRTFAARRFARAVIPAGWAQDVGGGFWAVLPLALGVGLALWSNGVFTATDVPWNRMNAGVLSRATNERLPWSTRARAALASVLPATDPRQSFWQRWGPHLLMTLRLPAYAVLNEAEFSTKPPGWTGLSANAAAELPRVTGPHWEERNLAHMHFSRSSLVQARFVRDSFGQADFSSADLRAARFQNCDAPEVNFSFAQIASGVSDRTALFGTRPGQPFSEATNAEFVADDFTKAHFIQSDLHEIVVIGCDFREAAFLFALAYSAEFHNCKFHRTNFCGADLREAWFPNDSRQRTDFQEAFFKAVEAREALFGYCDLRGARFEQANLEGADFSGAGTTLRPEQLLPAKCLRNVKLPPEMDLSSDAGIKVRNRAMGSPPELDPPGLEPPGAAQVPRRPVLHPLEYQPPK